MYVQIWEIFASHKVNCLEKRDVFFTFFCEDSELLFPVDFLEIYA